MYERDTPYGNYDEFEPTQVEKEDWEMTLTGDEKVEWVAEKADEEDLSEEERDDWIEKALKDDDLIEEILSEKYQQYLEDF